MNGVASIGPMKNLEVLVMNKIMFILSTSTLDTNLDRYGFMNLVMDSCNQDSVIQGMFTDVVNSFNGTMVESETRLIIPRIIKNYLDGVGGIKIERNS